MVNVWNQLSWTPISNCTQLRWRPHKPHTRCREFCRAVTVFRAVIPTPIYGTVTWLSSITSTNFCACHDIYPCELLKYLHCRPLTDLLLAFERNWYCSKLSESHHTWTTASQTAGYVRELNCKTGHAFFSHPSLRLPNAPLALMPLTEVLNQS